MVEASIQSPDEASNEMDILGLSVSNLEIQDTDDVSDKASVTQETDIKILLPRTSSNADGKKGSQKKIEENFNSFAVIHNNSRPLKIISLDELAWHDRADDCWIAIFDYIYDCTKFVSRHPGGKDVILEYAGRDATIAFIGARHSNDARRILEKHLIGELPVNERIFRKTDGIRIVELP